MSFTSKKGQGATEYLIILAVVIVIALIVVGVLGGIPGIGSNSQAQAARLYWESQDVAISDYFLSAGTDLLTLTVRNNVEDTITVQSITVGGTSNSTDLTLNPGETGTYVISKNCANQGDPFEYEVEVTYNNVAQNANYTFTGSSKILGQCAQ